MEFSVFYQKLNKKHSLPLPTDYKEWVKACNALKVHTHGARPAYMSNSGYITPESYNPKYDDIFKNRLLNRHPNESMLHYQWRLSIYSPVSKELFVKFDNLCKGSILQPNNYSVSADDNTIQWFNVENQSELLSEMLSFILQNPKGFFAVINTAENGENEKAHPEVICIDVDDIKMMDNESVGFIHKGEIHYLNANTHYYVKNNEVLSYEHNIGVLPFWSEHNTYLSAYQFWSESLVRNMNDDEAMVKHYSYPVVQIVESECYTCRGQKTVAVCDELNPNNIGTKTCETCNGTGTMSRNVGDYHTISEETIAKNGGQMYDVAKFITPDVAIPEYHLKRWQTFYNRVEQSLHLRSINQGVQSGDAKKEDRKDQYFFLQSISNYLFDNYKKALEYVSAYLNYIGGSSVIQPISIVYPKQFDLMSDSDLVNEFANLQAKTDDTQTLSELNYAVNNKIFRDDKVQLKINEVLYYADSLFGVSGNALKTKLLSGVYSDSDKIIHEKGYKILVNMSKEMTEQVFIELETNTLISLLNEKVSSLIPAGIYG